MKRLLAAIFVITGFAANDSVRVVESDCPAIGNQSVCHFRNGYLLRFSKQFDPVIRVYAPDGRFALNIPVSLPGAGLAWAEDVAVDSDGSFAIGATGSPSANERILQHALVLDDANGVQTAVIDTRNFVPGHVAFAGDHSIWVLGAQRKYEQPYTGDYMILRKYSRTGELIGSSLPRSTFPKGLEPGMAGAGGEVFTARNRIAVVAVSGETSHSLELIELDTDGHVFGRMQWQLHNVTNFAFTADGHFYSFLQYGREGIDLIDIPAGTVKNLKSPAPAVYLMGADGNDLVYRVRGEDGKTAAGWFGQPE